MAFPAPGDARLAAASSIRLGAFTLPPEIILMVTTYLTNPSVISLALTCRALHRLCFSQCPRGNTAEKKELLLLLERDMATLYFCHYCAKLHRWHTRCGNSISTWVEEDLPCKQRLDNFLFLPLICDIPYHHARLVMNQPFYGPTHGLPLHKLEKRVCLRCPSNRVTDSESLHAHIIDNKLLVLSVKTMYHSRGDSNLLHAMYPILLMCLFSDYMCPLLGAQLLAQQAKPGFIRL
jgi:hypothetical protein